MYREYNDNNVRGNHHRPTDHQMPKREAFCMCVPFFPLSLCLSCESWCLYYYYSAFFKKWGRKKNTEREEQGLYLIIFVFL